MITVTLDEIGTFMIESVYFLGAIFALAFSIIAYLEGRNAKKDAAKATAAAEKAEANMLLRVKEAEKKLADAASYAGIDLLLKDILQMAMNKPELRIPEKISEKLEKKDKEYSIYAEICMNFAETIYDDALRNDENRVTYAPTITDEIKLHGKWFLDKENRKRYKPEFGNFVEKVKADLVEKGFDVVCDTIANNPDEYISAKKKRKMTK